MGVITVVVFLVVLCCGFCDGEVESYVSDGVIFC